MQPSASPSPSRRTPSCWKTLARAAVLALSCTCLASALAQAPLPDPKAAHLTTATASTATPAVAPTLPTLAGTGAPDGAAASNAYGLRTVWAQGDFVARTTLVLLALMSLLSWYIIVAKFLEQRRQASQALAARAAFARAASVLQGAVALEKGSAYSFLADSAVEAMRKHESLAGQVGVGEWLTQDIVRNVATLQMRMHAGMSVLATVGSTAPFVGLFGTVWGIYHALVTIGSTGQASIEKVAGPVGEALIMTALGLAVAVPAVLGYNWLVRRNRLTMHGIKGFGSDLHTLLLVEIERNQRNPAPVAAPAAAQE